jgi:hypothetical protein
MGAICVISIIYEINIFKWFLSEVIKPKNISGKRLSRNKVAQSYKFNRIINCEK